MQRIFQPLLFFLARCSRNELIRQIEFLRVENQMLRKRIPTRHVVLNPEERARIIQLAGAIGPGIDKLITIVHVCTYRRWLRRLKNHTPKKRPGRPNTPDAIREFVIKLAKETGWGYTRILGELRKLGIGK